MDYVGVELDSGAIEVVPNNPMGSRAQVQAVVDRLNAALMAP